MSVAVCKQFLHTTLAYVLHTISLATKEYNICFSLTHHVNNYCLHAIVLCQRCATCDT